MSIRLHLADAAAGTLTVSGDRFHYLTRVLRQKAGDTLEVFDGAGRSFDAKVAAVDTQSATLELGEARVTAPPRKVTLIQGLPKADKLELVLQKCTELGASEFIPAAMKRSIVKLESERGAKKQQRWQRIVEEAARQCGRSDVPVVREPGSLADALRQVSGARVLVLDEAEHERSFATACAALRPDEPLAVVVGPEGGVDREELLELQRAGAVAVTLGRRVLRTETAGLVALTVLQHLDGELGG